MDALYRKLAQLGVQPKKTACACEKREPLFKFAVWMVQHGHMNDMQASVAPAYPLPHEQSMAGNPVGELEGRCPYLF